MAVKDGLPATDFSRQNREWVKAVAGGGSGGGGGLPEITAADEGKVLTVENGEAAWATDPYPGYDVVIQIDASDPEHPTGTVLKGVFESVYAKAMTFTPVSVLVAVNTVSVIDDTEFNYQNTCMGTASFGDEDGYCMSYRGSVHNAGGSSHEILMIESISFYWDEYGLSDIQFYHNEL